MGRKWGFAASGQAGLGKGLGGKWTPALQVPGTAVPWWRCWGSVSLSGPCLGCNGYSVLFQCSMEELGRGAHRPAGKFLSSVLLCHIPSTSSAGAGGRWLTGGFLPCQAVPGSQPHGSSSLLFQSQHLLCLEQALLLRSSCATAWDNPQTAGGDREGLETSPRLAPGLLAPRLPWAKPNLCNNGPATQDSPCACPWARQRLLWPCPPGWGVCWHCCHAAHSLQRPLLVLHEPPQAAAAPHSQLRPVDQCSQHEQSHPQCPKPTGCSERASDHAASRLPHSSLPPCSSRWLLGTC